MGSKAKFAKEILDIILKDRTEGQWYVEPFAGGMNTISRVTGNRIANDSHPYLMAMWKSLLNLDWKPDYISQEKYTEVRLNKDKFPNDIVGWIGFVCTFSGGFFKGYAGKTLKKTGKVYDYQQMQRNNIFKQIPNVKGIELRNMNYQDLDIPDNSIIYCDPPYQGTSSYSNSKDFDHDEFWAWCRYMSWKGHTVFISEYNAPPDFECIWSKDVKVSLSTFDIKDKTEKLFRYKL